METDREILLATDLGGTKIFYAVIDRSGNMLARDHSVTPAALEHEAVIEAIKASVAKTMDEGAVELSSLRSVGIGAPEPSNAEKGVLFSSPNLAGWKNVPIRDIIERLFDPAFETVQKRAYAAAYEAVRFVSPMLGRDSGVMGAAAHAFDKISESSP